MFNRFILGTTLGLGAALICYITSVLLIPLMGLEIQSINVNALSMAGRMYKRILIGIFIGLISPSLYMADYIRGSIAGLIVTIAWLFSFQPDPIIRGVFILI